MTASDKLFYWVFQNAPDRILQLQGDLPADAGYTFTAPVLKEREYRLDALFLPQQCRSELPALILEAQMGPDPFFLRRLYAETARLLQQESHIQHWRVLVICPHRAIGFGDPTAVVEFVERRIHWLELQPALEDRSAPPLLRTLGLLLQSEELLPVTAAEIRDAVAGSAEAAAMLDVMAAILITRFSGRPLHEICAMGGITLDDFCSSVAYREIFSQGRQEGRDQGRQEGRDQGRQEGRLEGEQELTRRLLQYRCGPLNERQQAALRHLSQTRLEALAEALLDFQGPADFERWLARAGSKGCADS